MLVLFPSDGVGWTSAWVDDLMLDAALTGLMVGGIPLGVLVLTQDEVLGVDKDSNDNALLSALFLLHNSPLSRALYNLVNFE